MKRKSKQNAYKIEIGKSPTCCESRKIFDPCPSSLGGHIASPRSNLLESRLCRFVADERLCCEERCRCRDEVKMGAWREFRVSLCTSTRENHLARSCGDQLLPTGENRDVAQLASGMARSDPSAQLQLLATSQKITTMTAAVLCKDHLIPGTKCGSVLFSHN